jgi:hypothetical protein
MSFDRLLIHALVVKRAATDGTLDEYGQPVTAPVDVATVPGRIQAANVREMALASQAGVPVGDHVAFLRPLEGLAQDCWLEFGGRRFDILGIRPQYDARSLHHLEVDLRSVA